MVVARCVVSRTDRAYGAGCTASRTVRAVPPSPRYAICLHVSYAMPGTELCCLSAYAAPTRCARTGGQTALHVTARPPPSSRGTLGGRLTYWPTRVLCDVRYWPSSDISVLTYRMLGIGLRTCYAMPGTEIAGQAYGGRGAVEQGRDVWWLSAFAVVLPIPVLTQRRVTLLICEVRYGDDVWWASTCAGAMLCPVLTSRRVTRLLCEVRSIKGRGERSSISPPGTDPSVAAWPRE
eukprot:1695428-Rhodomonas_salina.2